MIYFTGDTHGLIDFDKLEKFFKNEYVSEKDYLIILGDCGMVLGEDDIFIDKYSSLKLTIFFIDGNHENFKLLDKFPIVKQNNAKCHLIDHNIYHVMRGEIIILNGLKMLCMGGASSIDKINRVKDESWWIEENITESDIDNAIANLKRFDYNVDYVLTHCAPSKIVRKLFNYRDDSNTHMLDKLLYYIDFKHWFFGHYHKDLEMEKYRAFYNDIYRLDVLYNGKTKLDYNILTRESDEVFVHNRLSGRKTKIKEEDLPEWYYKHYSYRYWYYNLKGIKDIAFTCPFFDNHINKDSRIYLSYSKKLDKNSDESPKDESEWDCNTWRVSLIDFLLGVEKYSPKLNIDKVKAQVNFVYDQYINGSSYHLENGFISRPYPNIKTPHYKAKYGEKEGEYRVIYNDGVLAEICEEGFAVEYAKVFLEKVLKVTEFSIKKNGDDIIFVSLIDSKAIVTLKKYDE